MNKEDEILVRKIYNQITRLHNAVNCVNSHTYRIEKKLIGNEWKTEDILYEVYNDILHRILEELKELEDDLNNQAIPRLCEISKEIDADEE